MSAYSTITTMNIDTTKTLAIPPWGKMPEVVQDSMEDPQYHRIPRYKWAATRKYLGFMVGPAAQSTSRSDPTKNITGRLQEWPWKKNCLHLSLRVYNTLLLPTVLFVTTTTPTQLRHRRRKERREEHRRRATRLVHHGGPQAPPPPRLMGRSTLGPA